MLCAIFAAVLRLVKVTPTSPRSSALLVPQSDVLRRASSGRTSPDVWAFAPVLVVLVCPTVSVMCKASYVAYPRSLLTTRSHYAGHGDLNYNRFATVLAPNSVHVPLIDYRLPPPDFHVRPRLEYVVGHP